jgi:hypothetical protein
MFAWFNERKTEYNEMPLYFGEDGTRIRMKGTHHILNPTYGHYRDRIYRGLNEDDGTYTFPAWEEWVVVNPKLNYPTLPYDSQGHVTPISNLIGCEEESTGDLRNIVLLKPMSKFSTNAGICNNGNIIRLPFKEETRLSPDVHMTFEVFLKNIEQVYPPPPNIHLPAGTILRLRPYDEIKEELEADMLYFGRDAHRSAQTAFKVSDKRKQSGYTNRLGNMYLVVSHTPYRPFLGFVGKRTKSSYFPSYRRITNRIKRYKARKPPFKVDYVRYQMDRSHATFQYRFQATLKGNPNSLRSRNLRLGVGWLGDPEVIHHCIQKGFITIEGRYASKYEIKKIFENEMGKEALLNPRIKFDYTRPVPDIDSLSPTI